MQVGLALSRSSFNEAGETAPQSSPAKDFSMVTSNMVTIVLQEYGNMVAIDTGYRNN